jgi:hypothetical protein
MVNGAFNLSSNARYLGFQAGDAGLELFDRKRIEILARQRGDGIVGAAGQVVFRVHRWIVDLKPSAVNKRKHRIGANGGKCGGLA